MDSSSSPSSSPSRRRPRSDSQLHASATSAIIRPTSRQNHDPATPAESDGPVDDYFGTLSRAPPRRSRPSTFSLARPASTASLGGPLAGGANTERWRRPSIRIRPSLVGLTGGQQNPISQDAQGPNRQESSRATRPRSVSQPGPAPPVVGDGVGRGRNSRRPQPQISLPRLTEEGPRPSMAELGLGPGATSTSSPTLERSHSAEEVSADEGEIKPARRGIVGKLSRLGLRKSSAASQPQPAQGDIDARHVDEYNEQLVDWLDIIDPEVQTLSTLTNVQNSLFIPDLGSWVNRRPTYVLSQRDPVMPLPVPAKETAQPPEEPTIEEEVEEAEGPRPDEGETTGAPSIRRSNTITSRLSDSHYAALPHGETLEGWSAAEKWELNDHVRHMLHSRRSRFKRQMKGFGQYVRRPLGFFVTLYATLITLFGLAWVLFLIGWIYVGEQQVYAIHIIDSVLVALFAIMGDGLAPFRAIDTYHMIFIARHARIIAKAKKKDAKSNAAQSESKANIQSTDSSGTENQDGPNTSENRPATTTATTTTTTTPSFTVGHASGDLTNNNTTDENNESNESNEHNIDLEEDAKSTMSAFSLEEDYLTPKQRRTLAHHQEKLSKSHSFYKPHETFTHHAFPLGHLVAIIILLDFHSCLQISLGATTWGIDYHHRPFAITTVILCVSITCNLTAGLVIMFGDRRTRKKDVLDLLKRQALTGDAMKKVEKKRNKGPETDNGVLTGQGSGSGNH
ncbi:hypothetical protein C2857_007693 [Epichloe festucae Fl1]|uniref:Integral membrane protein n=1 Tax=Epichloe festucae (strain Fl1) TaxID=877507 RepID=A0A7S9KQZ8_EPIFF|nr:hypothetical protein C2857_007693 [Epichloe festucae Fl1]